MKKGNNKEVLNEALARFKQLNEYDFYVGEDFNDYDDAEDLILGEEGDEEEEEELPVDDMGGDEADIDIADLDDNPEELPADDMGGEELPADDMGGEELPVDDMGGEELPAEDEVELDVTDIVQGTDDAKQSADMANQKIDDLMGMIDNLEGKLNSMDGITSKIDNLENELEKRAPTPEEKIEMRSLDSYPYNLKLTDFWAEKEGQYDVMGVNDDESKPKDYSLTHDDIESDYNEMSVKDSFNDADEYEEEDI